jgi:hypothetical protein
MVFQLAFQRAGTGVLRGSGFILAETLTDGDGAKGVVRVFNEFHGFIRVRFAIGDFFSGSAAASAAADGFFLLFFPRPKASGLRSSRAKRTCSELKRFTAPSARLHSSCTQCLGKRV